MGKDKPSLKSGHDFARRALLEKIQKQGAEQVKDSIGTGVVMRVGSRGRGRMFLGDSWSSPSLKAAWWVRKAILKAQYPRPPCILYDAAGVIIGEIDPETRRRTLRSRSEA